MGGGNIGEAGYSGQNDGIGRRQVHGGRAGARMPMVRAGCLRLGTRADVTVRSETNVGESYVRRRHDAPGCTDHFEPQPVVSRVDEAPTAESVPDDGMQSGRVIHTAERSDTTETMIIRNAKSSVATVRLERLRRLRSRRFVTPSGSHRHGVTRHRDQTRRQGKCDAECTDGYASGCGGQHPLLAKSTQLLRRELLGRVAEVPSK